MATSQLSETSSKLTLPLHELETTGPVVRRERPTDWVMMALSERADWGHSVLGIAKCWAQFQTKGEGVRVAVLDTGVDGNHVDLVVSEGMDFSGSSNGWADIQSHGTHCAGIISARENGVGVVGVAPKCQILAGKVLGDDGSGDIRSIAKGIDWAVSRKVDVISMSLGGDGPIDPVMRGALDRAIQAGVIIVVAAGNSGPYPETVGSPGNYTPCITVGAIDQKKIIARFSSRGAEVDVVAPGVNILSTVPGNKMTTMSGTSMACPYVSGIAAMYVEFAKKLGATPSQGHFEKLIKSTALDLGVQGFDVSYGHGMVRPFEMLTALQAEFASPPPPPPENVPLPSSKTRIVVKFSDGKSQTLDDVESITLQIV